MTKFVKIVCIGFCFGICNLRSETYNVITVSRDIASDYNRLSTEAIYFVFAQLARCFHVEDSTILEIIRTSDQFDEVTKRFLIRSIQDIPSKKINVPHAPTIVVFNEAFFGKTEPLPQKKQEQKRDTTDSPPKKERRKDIILDVDGIIGVYNRFFLHIPNVYLYINFLYTSPKDAISGHETVPQQISISKNRYKKIEEKENSETSYPSFDFLDAPEEADIKKYITDAKNGPTPEQTSLLFNQTMIFYTDKVGEPGKYIGHYNKSSFCDEVSDFLDKKLYYVIGDFETHYFVSKPLPIHCLTCYDIDVISNTIYESCKNNKQIFAFASNTTTSLPCALNKIYGEERNKKVFICSDSYDGIESNTYVDGYHLSGVFEYRGLNFSPLEEKVCITFQEEVFTLKTFSLTTD